MNQSGPALNASRYVVWPSVCLLLTLAMLFLLCRHAAAAMQLRGSMVSGFAAMQSRQCIRLTKEAASAVLTFVFITAAVQDTVEA